MKILYCIVGIGQYGVLEGDILDRDRFFISAKRVFSVEADPTQVISSPKGVGMLSFIISTYEDVMMNCTFISNMSEGATFYKKIMEIVEMDKAKEKAREN